MYINIFLIAQCLMLCLVNTFFSFNEKEDTLLNSVKYEGDYTITFYPEGGHLFLKTGCRVGFKAAKLSGEGENITGKIVDDEGNSIQSVITQYQGVGSFSLYVMTGRTYYLECENENGLCKRFELPPALGRGYGIKTGREKNRLLVSIAKPDDMPLRDSLYLTVQSGKRIFYDKLWDNTKTYLSFNWEYLPSGVIRVLLLDANKNIVSERLIVNRMNVLSDISTKSYLADEIDSFASFSGLDSIFVETALDAFLLTQSGSKVASSEQDTDSDLWKTVSLKGVVVEGVRRKKENKGLYSASVPPGKVITKKEIDEDHIQDMRLLLFRFSGVTIVKGGPFNKELIFIRGFEATTFQADPINNYQSPLVVIDDIPYNNYEILSYPITDIEEIFVLKGADAAIFGPKAQNGIIVIRTKRGTSK